MTRFSDLPRVLHELIPVFCGVDTMLHLKDISRYWYQVIGEHSYRIRLQQLQWGRIVPLGTDSHVNERLLRRTFCS